jgi:CRP-like cAMP-binding protein
VVDEAPQRDDGLANILALKAIPALSQAHPDDLIGLALRARERRFPAGAPLASGHAEPALYGLVEGRVRELRAGREHACHDAPALPGLLAVLAGDEEPALLADGEVIALEIGRSDLLEALEDEFELCVAALRHVCQSALDAGAPSGWAPATAPRAPLAAPADLAERIVFLRRAVPFAGLRIALLGQLALDLEVVTAESGSVLWEADEPATHLLLIAGGSVGIERGGAGETQRLTAGALVGLLETLAGGEYGFRLRAHGAVQALRLEGEALLDALEDDAASALALACGIARHLQGGGSR